MNKYKVFKKEVKQVGTAERVAEGLLIEINGDKYIIEIDDLDAKKLKPIKEIKKKEGLKYFQNKITKKVDKSYYSIKWKKEAIKELSLKFNDYYSDSIHTKKLREIFTKILKNHEIKGENQYQGYKKYFLVNGQLERMPGKRYSVYKVNRDKLIPKTKQKKDLGILDELSL